MQLIVDNIWSIEHAEVNFDGITILAGENDTGKSTISKSLYSLFSIFYGLDRKRYNIIAKDVTSLLEKCGIDAIKMNKDVYGELVSDIVRLRYENLISFDKCKGLIAEYAK